MNSLIAVVAGLLVVGGVLAILAGLSTSWPEQRAHGGLSSISSLWARLSRRPPGDRGRRRDVLLCVSLTAGFVVAAVSGWLIAVPLVPVLVFGLPYL
ncbi:MAG: hypothetical protein H0T91_07135, partial [Propionibacteriaceae bacterium]|nr:hypothetical protein [Propionibacteriaceae bacterium]